MISAPYRWRRLLEVGSCFAEAFTARSPYLLVLDDLERTAAIAAGHMSAACTMTRFLEFADMCAIDDWRHDR